MNPILKVDDLLDSRLMARLDRLDVISRKIFAGKIQGERRSKRRGQSVEFADFRPYVHGAVVGEVNQLSLQTFAIIPTATIYDLSIGISMPASIVSF